MKLLRVMQTGRPVTALQYHRSSDCLLYSSLEHGVISGAPLGTGSFPDLEAPGRPEGIYHFALDPSQQIIAVSTRKNQGLLYHLSDQRWQSLNLLLQDEMEPDSRSADSCPYGFNKAFFPPCVGQVCFSCFAFPATFRVDFTQEKPLPMMRGATLSSSTGADFVCLRSNYECRSYFCFFFADDCGLDAAEQTCQFPIITLFVSTTAHGDVHAPFRCSRLSPDAARLLLFGGELDNFVQVWDLTTFQLVGQAKVAGPEHASPRSALRDLWDNVFFTNFEYVDDHMWDNALVSPNGRRAFLPNEPSNTLIEFSLDPVAHEGQIPAPHTAFITAQCLIPGKNQAATASADGSIALWQFAETEIHDGPAPQTFGGTLRQRIRQHPDFPDRHGECVTFENFAAHLAQARR